MKKRPLRPYIVRTFVDGDAGDGECHVAARDRSDAVKQAKEQIAAEHEHYQGMAGICGDPTPNPHILSVEVAEHAGICPLCHDGMLVYSPLEVKGHRTHAWFCNAPGCPAVLIEFLIDADATALTEEAKILNRRDV